MGKRPIKQADSRRKGYIRTLLQKNPKDLKFCVIGAGHGGLAMAGHLAVEGFKVNLYNRGKRRIRPVSSRKGIKVEGEVSGFGRIELVSNNILDCLDLCYLFSNQNYIGNFLYLHPCQMSYYYLNQLIYL